MYQVAVWNLTIADLGILALTVIAAVGAFWAYTALEQRRGEDG